MSLGPHAYLINLLDMIHDHWRITTSELETILLQKINDLDCKTSQEALLQIELAIEILEKDSRIKFPLTDSTYINDVEKVWVKLLFVDDLSKEGDFLWKT